MDKHTWYFAYGSNLKKSRLRKRKVTVYDHKVGYICDYSFSYSKIGVDNSGKGNICPLPESRVWGAFYHISMEDYIHLHANYEIGYRPIDVTGFCKDETIQSKSFIASPENISRNIKPSSDYYNIVIKGANEHNLPADHIQILEQR